MDIEKLCIYFNFLRRKSLPYGKNIMFYKSEKFWFLDIMKTAIEFACY